MNSTSFPLSSLPDIEAINESQSNLHHAVQFIAIAGKFLAEAKEDDSHTSMSWNPKSEQFIGVLLNERAKVAFHIPSFSLNILGPTGLVLANYPLVGNTKYEGLTWLKQALQLKQLKVDHITYNLHYDIPDHDTDEGEPFKGTENPILDELSHHRSIAELVCSSFINEYEHASPMRTWPHHFDHGSYIPFKFDQYGNAVQSFSIGYAIADHIVNEPYFYVTQWHKNQSINYENAPPLEEGKWYPEKLKGAALSCSKFSTSDNPIETIKTFLTDTINWSVRI